MTPAFFDIDPFFAGLFAGFLAAGVFLAAELDLTVELAELFDAVFFDVVSFFVALGFLTPAPVFPVFFAAAFFGLFTNVTASGMNLSGAPGRVPSLERVVRVNVDFGGDAFGGNFGFGCLGGGIGAWRKRG